MWVIKRFCYISQSIFAQSLVELCKWKKIKLPQWEWGILLPPLTSLNKFSLSNYTHAGTCNTENNNAALQTCLIKPQPIVHAVYVSAHEFLWLRIWSCVWVLERRRLVPAGSGAPCATQPVCSHNTHFIIGLRGARRSARRLRIMLIYGIYCHRSIPITYLALL